jgi:hypothetical protein
MLSRYGANSKRSTPPKSALASPSSSPRVGVEVNLFQTGLSNIGVPADAKTYPAKYPPEISGEISQSPGLTPRGRSFDFRAGFRTLPAADMEAGVSSRSHANTHAERGQALFVTDRHDRRPLSMDQPAVVPL